MSIKTTLIERMKQAMKARDQVALDTIRFVLSEIKNKEIDQGELTDDQLILVLQKEIAKLQEAAKQFSTGGREDLAEANNAQIQILSEFVPSQLSEEELKPLMQEFLAEQSTREFKELIKLAIPRFKSQTNGKTISSVLTKLLE